MGDNDDIPDVTPDAASLNQNPAEAMEGADDFLDQRNNTVPIRSASVPETRVATILKKDNITLWGWIIIGTLLLFICIATSICGVGS